jgi:hypothetical protein
MVIAAVVLADSALLPILLEPGEDLAITQQLTKLAFGKGGSSTGPLS